MGGSGMAARKWHARGVDMRARAKKYGVVRA